MIWNLPYPVNKNLNPVCSHCMKVALVHELLTMRGGAERVLRVFADLFPDAPIYTFLYDEKKLGDWFPKERVRTASFPSLFPGFYSLFPSLRTNHHLYLPFFPRAAEHWDFSGYDLVLSSSSAFAHGIITNGRPKHLCYVQSPARYLWDRTHDVLNRAGKELLGPLKKAYLSHIFNRLRTWDAESSDRPDHLIAASKTVQRRIELYWRRESEVIYPPIDDFWFEQRKGLGNRSSGIGKSHSYSLSAIPYSLPYYLVVSTLAPYKRISLAIKACNQLKARLIIAGDGPAKKSLQAIAGPTIEFAGHQTDEQLRDLYTDATATIFPGDEDFGLVPLESLSCGTPVIAFDAGGARETLKAGKTCVFFREPTAVSLQTTIAAFDRKAFDSGTCKKAAAKFGRTAFEKKMKACIDDLMASATLRT